MQTLLPLVRNSSERQETSLAQMQAVECAIQIMHTHMDEPLTLEDLASSAYLSPSHFHRVFQRQTGVPPVEFLSALRFQTARDLLLTTSLSVTDICFEVGYTSTGSFTSRFTQRVGLSPRQLRQRASVFEPVVTGQDEAMPAFLPDLPQQGTLIGCVSTPEGFRGTIYVGLFPGPVPQGAPIRCTRLYGSGQYRLNGIPDGIYHLRTAAFPTSSDLRSSLLPGEKLLVGSSTGPVIVQHGRASGNANLVLHPPRLTDPPLVMGLPLL